MMSLLGKFSFQKDHLHEYWRAYNLDCHKELSIGDETTREHIGYTNVEIDILFIFQIIYGRFSTHAKGLYTICS